MRKIKTVKIELEDKTVKKFVIKELTCQNIIDLTQSNSLFTDSTDKNSENGEGVKSGKFLSELGEYGNELKTAMKMCCDFSLEDLKQLSPSEIKLIYEAFKEVNSDFLSLLEKVGILKLYNQMVQRVIKTFSGTFAPLLNQDIQEP